MRAFSSACSTRLVSRSARAARRRLEEAQWSLTRDRTLAERPRQGRYETRDRALGDVASVPKPRSRTVRSILQLRPERPSGTYIVQTTGPRRERTPLHETLPTHPARRSRRDRASPHIRETDRRRPHPPSPFPWDGTTRSPGDGTSCAMRSMSKTPRSIPVGGTPARTGISISTATPPARRSTQSRTARSSIADSDYPGRVVIIQHDGGIYSMYGHLDYALLIAEWRSRHPRADDRPRAGQNRRPLAQPRPLRDPLIRYRIVHQRRCPDLRLRLRL